MICPYWAVYQMCRIFKLSTLKKTGINTDIRWRTQREKLTSCCWSVCPAQRSCNFRAAYRSEATRPCHSRQRSPQQSSHLTDPGLRRSYCALAEHTQTHTHVRLNTESKETENKKQHDSRHHARNTAFTISRVYIPAVIGHTRK